MDFSNWLTENVDDPQISQYEKDNFHALPPGWSNWNDMQKRIHIIFKKGQQQNLKTPNRAQATTTAEKPKKFVRKWFDRNWM